MATYTVTFKDWDGSVLETQSIEEGSNATPPSPTRAGYDFTGWDESYINITSDVTLTAQYDEMTTSLYNFLNWNDPIFNQPNEVKTSDNVIDYNTTHIKLSSSIDNTGVSEVSSSILSEINNAISNGKILVIPPGIYLIKKLSIPANAKIHFMEDTLIKHDVATSSQDRCIILDGENIKITGRLTVDGCWENQTLNSEHIHNVAIFDAPNSSIESVITYNSASDCLYISGNDGNSPFPTGVRIGYAKCTKAKRKTLVLEHIDDCVIDVAILDNTEGSSTGQGGHCIDVEPYNYKGTYTANNTIKYCYMIGSGNDVGGTIREKGRNYVLNINTLVANVVSLHTAYGDANEHEKLSVFYSLGIKVIVGNAKINLPTTKHPDWVDSDGKGERPSIVNAAFGGAFKFGSIIVKGGVPRSSLFNIKYSTYSGIGGAPICTIDYLKMIDCNHKYIVCADKSNFTVHNYMSNKAIEQSTTRYGIAGTLIFGKESTYTENVELDNITRLFSKVYLGNNFISRIYYGSNLINYNLPSKVEPTSISISGVYLDDVLVSSPAVGVEYTLKTTILPENTYEEYKTVKYRVDNSSITLSGDKITFSETGWQNVYASINEFDLTTAYSFYVYPYVDKYVESITLNSNNISLYVGDTFQLEATVLPTDATIPDLSYDSYNDNICTISDTGLITAVSTGGCNVFVRSTDGSGITAVCGVTVSERVILDVPNLFDMSAEMNYTYNGSIATSYLNTVSEYTLTVNAYTGASGSRGSKFTLNPNTDYTLICQLPTTQEMNIYAMDIDTKTDIAATRYRSNVRVVWKFNTGTSTNIVIGFVCASATATTGTVQDIMLIEGDYTANPPDFVPYTSN